MFDSSTLPSQTVEVLVKLVPFVSDFYLAGGTALSMYYEHRISKDLDFFTQTELDLLTIRSELIASGIDLANTDISSGTLHCLIDDVRVSFMEYRYNLLESFSSFLGVNVASVVDIACMKLSAIMGRAEKKDYSDLAEILENEPLDKLIQGFKVKYGSDIDTYPILKSLCYFDDVESSPGPLRTIKSWKQVKSILVEACRNHMEM